MGSIARVQATFYRCSYCNGETKSVTFVNSTQGRNQRLQEKIDAINYWGAKTQLPLAICPDCKAEVEKLYDRACKVVTENTINHSN